MTLHGLSGNAAGIWPVSRLHFLSVLGLLIALTIGGLIFCERSVYLIFDLLSLISSLRFFVGAFANAFSYYGRHFLFEIPSVAVAHDLQFLHPC